MTHARHAKPRWTVSRRSAGAAGALGLFTAAAGGLVGPVSAANALGPNLIVNGSFEDTPVPVAPGDFGVFPSILGWAATAGIEVLDNYPGLAPAPGAGDQFTELAPYAATRITQDVATVPGATYRLSYLFSPRPGYAASEAKMAVTAGPASTTVSALTDVTNTSWTQFTLDFVADALTTTVAFEDIGGGTAGAGPLLDKVALNPIEVDCSAAPPVGAIVGTGAGEIINGTGADDVIFGLGGGDSIDGKGGADVVCGGAGGDYIQGGGGDDVLEGGAGGDLILGQGGDDTLRGGTGGDSLDGGAGTNTIDGGPGGNLCNNPSTGPGCP